MDVENTTNTNGYNIMAINQGSQPVFDFIFKSKTVDENSHEDLCKICLSAGSDQTNPLVSLCKCTGGMSFAHYECLKRWMSTKLAKKENDKKTVTSYNIKSYNCEICKFPYPFRFSVNNTKGNTIYDLIEIVRPTDKSYIILESLNQLKDNNNLKSIHVIILEDEKITLGRGHESDVRINDISVSRQHAVLIFDSNTGKITIRDLKSKFGTLALIKNDLKIKEKKIQLQIGRTLLECGLISTGEYERIKKSKADKKNQFQQPQFNLQTQSMNQSSFPTYSNNGPNGQEFALNQNNEFHQDINEHENLSQHFEEEDKNLNKKK